jgi:hypothetical protein
MRVLLRAHINTEAGNEAFASGAMQTTLQGVVDRLQPEAAYFAPEHGLRTAMFVFDLKRNADLPAIAEPLFQVLGAEIEVVPVMNLDEVMAGMREAEEAAKG